MKLTPIVQPLTLSGEGNPNGRFVASVGSIYTDTLATGGALRWIKTTWTGFSGWRVLSGTTGRKTLYTSAIPPEWGTVSIGIYIIRTEDEVTMDVRGFIPQADNGIRRVLTIPPGFLPDIGLFSVPLLDRDNRPKVSYFDISTSGEMTMHHLPDGTGRHYGSITWRCTSPWPS